MLTCTWSKLNQVPKSGPEMVEIVTFLSVTLSTRLKPLSIRISYGLARSAFSVYVLRPIFTESHTKIQVWANNSNVLGMD